VAARIVCGTTDLVTLTEHRIAAKPSGLVQIGSKVVYVFLCFSRGVAKGLPSHIPMFSNPIGLGK
jgi:hypothetical protein